MIDRARIEVKAGTGGNGAVSFRREKYVPRGGPDGGDGGRGGHVYLEARADQSTLAFFRHRHRFEAGSGSPGQGSLKHGKDGEDLVIPVSVGTVVIDEETGVTLADLVRPGQRFLVARGGRGGHGNAYFATPRRRTPRLAERGQPGEERVLRLELKLLADVGLIGLPNAGKSSLLARISAARPRIADYPFTTLEPELGVVEREDGTSFVVADIPGLIEGAHAGAGLGHEFLRHIERTRLLIHVVDLSGLTGVTPERAYEIVREEIGQYDPSLRERPELVAANKLDLSEARESWPAFAAYLGERGVPPSHLFPISAATGEGVRQLLDATAALLVRLPPAFAPNTVEEESYRAGPGDRAGWGREDGEETAERVIALPVRRKRKEQRETGIQVIRQGNEFRVEGEAVSRFLERFDIRGEEALREFLGWLQRTGVEEMLRRSGARAGDTVRIGETEFEFWE